MEGPLSTGLPRLVLMLTSYSTEKSDVPSCRQGHLLCLEEVPRELLLPLRKTQQKIIQVTFELYLEGRKDLYLQGNITHCRGEKDYFTHMVIKFEK